MSTTLTKANNVANRYFIFIIHNLIRAIVSPVHLIIYLYISNTINYYTHDRDIPLTWFDTSWQSRLGNSLIYDKELTN